MDESRPIRERLEEVVPSSGSMVPYLGRAVITAILLVMYPGKYGVWNNTSEAALKQLNIWPYFERGTSFGERYSKVNQLLQSLSKELGISLWNLDTLWWLILAKDEDEELHVDPFFDEDDLAQRFGLERYLHEFLKDNWERIEFFRDWMIHEEDGEPVGHEYPADIGRIDLLARHRSEPKWLVIELKRDQSSDETIGQVLRYMGWVEEKLALSEEQVQGLIISRAADDRMKYALRNTRNVDLWFYEVDFDLKPSGQGNS